MFVDKNSVSQNRVRAEYADLVGPLDRGFPMALDHRVKLDDALRRVRCERTTALASRFAAVAEQLLGTGINLRWIEHFPAAVRLDASRDCR